MKSPFSVHQPVDSTFLYDYQSDSPAPFGLVPCPGFSGRFGYDSRGSLGHATTLSLVFDGETHRCFSSARIVLYCDTSCKEKVRACVPFFKQAGPITHTFRGDLRVTLPNNPALPQLTVACQVIPRWESYVDFFDLFPASTKAMTYYHRTESTCILLDVEHPIFPNTSFLSVAFRQSKNLRALSQPWPRDGSGSKDFVSTRTIRVVPTHSHTRSCATVGSLPTEILMHIFEAAITPEWQHDLLSFAQVCRRWSCAMKVLFTRLESSEWRKSPAEVSAQSLHPCEFAKALISTPVLGLDVRHLHLDQHNGSYKCSKHSEQKASPGFQSALLTILRATKHLQHLSLTQGYSSQTNTLFRSLPKLRTLHTFSITRTRCQFKPVTCAKYWRYSISSYQLGCCMARWPGLTSLTVEHLKPGAIGMTRRLFMRPPACALTQLCIRQSYLSDKDFLFLTASSAKSLTQVMLEDVRGLTHHGLLGFLESTAQNLISLTLRDLAHMMRRVDGPVGYPLDNVVPRMPCLETLSIRGSLASERMLRRRSEAFVRCRGLGDAALPVVQLTAQFVPEMTKPLGDGWPGWEVVEFQSVQTPSFS